MTDMQSRPPHLHFVTGRLAERALRSELEQCSATLGFQYSIGVMPITVAALITPRWLLRHLQVPVDADEVILPGFIGNDVASIQQLTQARVRIGPKDLRDLPDFLGGTNRIQDLSTYDIEIIAEINHAPRMSIDQLLIAANQLRKDGADRIDVGCQPGETWSQIGSAIRTLIAEGHIVSVDSFNPIEVNEACKHGASLVLSVNSENVQHAEDWGVEVVAIPDTPEDLSSLDRTINELQKQGIAFRVDPILEPIGLGLMASLVRYHTIRHRYPEVAMMMGIGNLTELTDVDSAGVNMLLLGICAELQIHSVLTTQVINWARTSVKECDIARRVCKYAVENRVPPKRISDELVILRDPKLPVYTSDWFTELAAIIRDHNYRLFAQDQLLHIVSAGLHLSSSDPFEVFESLLSQPHAENIDVSHAFYLGYELAKAKLALTLGKQYDQDQSLNWGCLTDKEDLHRLQRGRRKRDPLP